MSLKAVRTKIQRRPLHGVLLLDKPIGLSSNDALQKAKWLLRAEKAGHTGTLDPLATGVLPLCFGAATKFSQMHLDADKTYTATLKLGQTTTTGDAEGEVLNQTAVAVTREQVLQTVASFVGNIQQTPPMYSALKHEGRPLYEYARAGIHIERPARPVRIHQIAVEHFLMTNRASVAEFIEFDAIKIVVTCSKGTYIRTLAEDIGKALGCGAHLIGLRRTATGPFDEGSCISLAQIEALPDDKRPQLLQPVEDLLHGAENITLNSDNSEKFLSGLRRRGQWPDSDVLAVFGDTPRAFLGSAHAKAGELIPTRLLSPQEVSQTLLQQAGMSPRIAAQT